MIKNTETIASLVLQRVKCKIDDHLIDFLTEFKDAGEKNDDLVNLTKRVGLKTTQELNQYIIDEYNSFVNNANVFIDILKIKYADTRLNNILIDFFITESPNAFTIYVREDNSYAIGVDYRYILLIQQIGTAAIHCVSKSSWTIPISEDNFNGFLNTVIYNVNKIQQQNDETIERQAIDFLLSLSYLGNITQSITFYTSWFIVAHEVAHIVLNHFDGGKKSLFKFFEGDSKLHEISSFIHQKEFEADVWAFSTLKELFQKNEFAANLVQIVPLMFMATCDIIHTLINPQSSIAKYLSKTHPPWNERYKNLEKLSNIKWKTEHPKIEHVNPLQFVPHFILQVRDRFIERYLKIYGKKQVYDS